MGLVQEFQLGVDHPMGSVRGELADFQSQRIAQSLNLVAEGIKAPLGSPYHSLNGRLGG